jgi:hypothetical protein
MLHERLHGRWACAVYSLLAALVLVTLDNGEGARVLVVLHHKPDHRVSLGSHCDIAIETDTHQPRVSLSLL